MAGDVCSKYILNCVHVQDFHFIVTLSLLLFTTSIHDEDDDDVAVVVGVVINILFVLLCV